jgi:thymidylate kinase
MEKIDTQKKVEEIYLKLVQEKELIRINGKRSMEEAAKDIQAMVLGHLKKLNSSG